MRQSRSMDEVREFAAADQGLAVVSFARRDGSVHSSVVNAGVMAHPLTGEETAALVTPGNTVKLRRLREHPQAALVFRSGWAWIGVAGGVSIIGPRDPAEGFHPADLPQLLREVFISAGGTHDDWDEYDRVMREESRTAVFIHPARITGTGRP